MKHCVLKSGGSGTCLRLGALNFILQRGSLLLLPAQLSLELVRLHIHGQLQFSAGVARGIPSRCQVYSHRLRPIAV